MCRINIPVMYLLVQLKRTMEELSSVLEGKEELLQRCHELDMQVRYSLEKWY